MCQKKDIVELKRELYDMSISLEKFLIMYGLCDESILNAKMSHKDVKKIIPELKRISFEALPKYRIQLRIGEIIGVRDSYGQVLPYINPELLMTDINVLIDIKMDKYDVEINNLIENENLNAYELEIACKKFKELKRYKEYKIAKRLLNQVLLENTKKVKRYKREKIEIMYKEMEYEYKIR